MEKEEWLMVIVGDRIEGKQTLRSRSALSGTVVDVVAATAPKADKIEDGEERGGREKEKKKEGGRGR
jgi:hypothetical protein